MKIINNPFDLVMQAVNELYPGTEALIQFNPELRGIEDGECGCTTFPDDGSVPVVDISANIPFWAAIEILAHELAHVVAGPADDHGNEWQAAFTAIHRKYSELAEEMKNLEY